VWPLRCSTSARDDGAPFQDARRVAESRPKLEHGADAALDGDPAQPGHEATQPGRAALGLDALFHKGPEEGAATNKRPVGDRCHIGHVQGGIAKRRCLVPADAFYDWKALADRKQPYAIARTDGTPLAFAGLWEAWRSPEGEVLRTFTILTTAANSDMAQLHNRMPVILEEEDWCGWLGEVPHDPVELLRSATEGVLKLWPVSRAVNSVKNNGAELLDRIDDPAAPPPSDAAHGENPA
jgi:hypothetical protein